MATSSKNPAFQLLKLAFAIGLIIAAADVACTDASAGESSHQVARKVTSCQGLMFDIDIDERRDGQAWDTFGIDNPFTKGNEAKPDPYGRIRLSGAVSGSERLRVRKNTFHVEGAPFSFGLDEIPLEGVTVHLNIKDKDQRNDDLIVRDSVPLELLMSDDGHFVVAPNAQVSVRARCR